MRPHGQNPPVASIGAGGPQSCRDPQGGTDDVGSTVGRMPTSTRGLTVAREAWRLRNPGTIAALGMPYGPIG